MEMLTFVGTVLALAVFVFSLILRRHRLSSTPLPSTQIVKKAMPRSEVGRSDKTPLAVNYHFTRVCNYHCGFCFHTNTNDYNLPIDEAKKGLKLLKDAGMKKINYAGGEPFMYPKLLAEMIRFCKEELQVESVSIVSNGSKLKDDWFEEYGRYIDILAVSCDSFNSEVNRKIGRSSLSKNERENAHVENVTKASELCSKHGIKFKINTVVNHYNWEEDMNDMISQLKPHRWKVFQVLVLKGENDGDGSKRDATEFIVSDEEFKSFIDRHSELECLVPEDNKTMKNSYLILDEKMRFLNCQDGGKVPSESLLEVGVANALKQSGFDSNMFQARGGQYDWTRDQGCGETPEHLQW